MQHVSMNVEGRLDEVRRFYRDVLGLADDVRPVIPGVEGHWFRLAGDVQLHLVDAPSVGPTDDHVCLFVEDLDAAIEELVGHGVAVTVGGQGDVRQVWFADPAGNVVELQQNP